MIDEAWVGEVAHGPLADQDLELILADAARLAGVWRALSKQSEDPQDFGVDAAPMRRAVAFSSTIAYSRRVAGGLPAVVAASKMSSRTVLDGTKEHEGSGRRGGTFRSGAP